MIAHWLVALVDLHGYPTLRLSNRVVKQFFKLMTTLNNSVHIGHISLNCSFSIALPFYYR
ncbi:hypothetical protein BGX38DRAFT_422282 [Terfezia claveryi]|nr:hypothetical protein BGX38DRAFT_422282 [Terfezia claveryi]